MGRAIHCFDGLLKRSGCSVRKWPECPHLHHHPDEVRRLAAALDCPTADLRRGVRYG